MTTAIPEIYRISGYKLIEILYQGSKTEVYRAIRIVDQQPVVIKILQVEYPTFNELLQFRNQYTIAKKLNISSIVHPQSLEAYRNGYALVMEDFGGISLRQYTQNQSLELMEFFTIALQLSNILHELHQERVIHKDIKPTNILINPHTKQIKIIDFSIASLLPRENQTLINPKVLEGTLAYLSPEQTGRMNRGVDYRSDFYSLGVTFFELLTGQLPFESDDPMELVHCHIAKQPPILGGRREEEKEIPQVLGDIVMKLMAKNAEDRYQSALGLKHDLENCLCQLNKTGKIERFQIGQRDICDRFIIPEKLYGRETAVQQLLEAFERVSLGSHEMMLISGFAGIGKTAVVNEVHKPIIRQRGYFIKGKFDQFKRNIPLSGFVQSLRDLMVQLLTETDQQLQQWRKNILAVLRDNGQILIEVIPELEKIIGQQPPIPELTAEAAQNRFNLLLKVFIQIFTTKQHPLVIFIDDLQWADLASLKLIKLLMNESDGYLLLIGAYRDNEVSSLHPLISTLDEIGKASTIINLINLQNLNQVKLNQLVADTLGCKEELAFPLSKLVCQKTQGNPFFATQFLKALHQDGLITFNFEEGCWQCDIARINQQAMTDDVLEFMAFQLRRLPESTQQVLKLAACIGNQFDLATLAIVSEQLEIETAACLWNGLQEGLILPQSEVYKFFVGQEEQIFTQQTSQNTVYKFLHDRVQQAAYSLIPDDQKQATHYKIGMLLLRNSSDSEQEERLFEIVTHLNAGSSLITQLSERQELAELNLIAGRRAKSATAYTVAVEYFTVGISLLSRHSWESHYDLTLALYIEVAEATYLNTDFEQMEQWVTIVLQHANTLLDSIPIYVTRMMAAKSQGLPLKTLNIGSQVLQLLGIEFPQQPTPADIGQAAQATMRLWERRSSLDLLNLSTMSDAHCLAAMSIMSKMVPAAYLATPALMPLLIFKQVEFSIKYGNCPVSVYAYADYGIILCGVLGKLEAGYEFGQLALNLLEQLQSKTFKCRTYFIVYNFIRHWKDPLGEQLVHQQEGYQNGLETGDLDATALNAQAYCQYAYFAGRELSGLANQMAAYRQSIYSLKQESPLQYLDIVYQAVLNLLGHNQSPDRLTGTIYNAEQRLSLNQATQDRTGFFHWQVNQTILWYLFGQYQEAAQQSAQAKQYLDAGIAQFSVALYFFYDSLIHLSLYKAATESEQQQILAQVEANQEKMQRWAALAACNHQHRWDLVEAERFAILSDVYDGLRLRTMAIEFYDRAIAKAKENGFLQDEALANELAAKFYLNWGKEKVAQAYMQTAYSCYARWGAKAKTDDLEKRYFELLRPILQQVVQTLNPLETLATIANPVHAFTHTATSSSTSINNLLDFSSILRASQTLSATIQLDEFLQQLTQIILENAGADKCALLLPENDKWQIRAITSFDSTSLKSEPLENNPNVPIALIQYVKNTASAVVVDDLKTHLPIVDDYLSQHQPKSVLCLPILSQGRLVGILYLENNLTSGVFTRDRILVLNFLCTQAAISLENARLYANLQQSEARFQKVTDNVPGAIYQLYVTPEHLVSMPYISSGCYNLYEVTAEEIISGQQNPRFLEHPDDIAGINQAMMKSAQSLTPFVHEWRIITPSGIMKWVQAASRPEMQVDGAIVWDGLILDISDRKAAEAVVQQKSQQLEQAIEDLQKAQLQIVQSEKMSALGNLVAGVAHEINNPIGFIAGNVNEAKLGLEDIIEHLQLYRSGVSPTEIEQHAQEIEIDYLLEDIPKMIESMNVGCDRIKNISTSLRTFSRADKDYKVPFNIHEGIDSTILILKHRLKANEKHPAIEVITNYGNIPEVECFPGQLNQVFMNLLANAIDALEESNQGYSFEEITVNHNYITITTSIHNNTHVKIQISDNGIGMNDDVKKRIFEHLFTTKLVGKGTGLGLAIARQIIVEKHEGTLKVNSTFGQGSEFEITLPIGN
ncbi:ATP-binding sensor histidine kinase [Nostoc sp. TCL240-02]|uniref:trifunctional serine/threonine-protein kinase/ATP-binding protein/sensor histidine kinase n=1 Tax=Nostoc sp. TCL240-02 TaxID=2572090 RepID=UPI00157F8727|nr:ATP-binding sensor histidine kinase [Nostoc sp. TCL240-02]QKQ73002.1 GAF domain-containing protein [Nostoc sp. TCL240-02]